LKILLVEDDEVDRMAFERFVQREDLGYDYVVADSVAKAREILSFQEFDVILLDYNLGDGTAFDVIDLEPDAPIILITGVNQIDLAVKAMKAGAYDYLVKDQERDYLQVMPIAVESALRRKEAEDTSRVLSHAVMSAADSVFITDLEGKITIVNNAALQAYGYSAEELLGKDIGVIGEVGTEGEYYHRHKDGTEFPVSLSRSAVIDDRGREVAFVVMARDIAERKRAEVELKRINAELEGFAHTVSHDLKGPLASTVLAASTLEEIMKSAGLFKEGSDIEKLLGIIDNNVWKSAALIDDLLALAEAGQTPDSLEKVDIGELVERILEENAGIVHEKGIKVKVDEKLGTVLGSPAHIYQLFTNLIGNCVKHCDSARPVVTVSFLGKEKGGARRYLVRDNGKGIPPEDIDKVFTPFFKGVGGGTGIGLATAEKVVKLYGGEIRAYNDNGACFEFIIKNYSA